ncbi:MAG: SDR family NAD(P)-dependent oxidoreductase [Deltaproteobacteria bacterium]|nr:SDR family NAD(P)-dependent oxidoreductase [Deltaproteobacteria bacterium]
MILITGGAGFIGANLVRSLTSSGCRLKVLDNLSAGRAEDLAGLPVEFLQGDIRHRTDVAAAMAGVEAVVHLAADTGVVDSVANPEFNLEVNVRGTFNLLQEAVACQVERFVFASTGGAIMGEVTPPVHEDMVPRPISPYGASKLAAEGYCSAFWGSYGLKTISLRFSNVYGPFSYHKGSVIAKLFRQVMVGEPITIFGDGEQTRDFVFVADLCEAIRAALEADLPFGQALQLGTGRETSINQLVAMMRQVVQEASFPPVKHVPPRAGEVSRNFVKIDKAKKFLGFDPKTGLLEGLQLTWQWFRQQPLAAGAIDPANFPNP